MKPQPEEVLFREAAALAGPERAACLDRVCAGHPALRARLEALLATHDHPDTLLATPTPHTRPTLTVRPADTPDPAVGQLIGRYRLVERLGEGGCGVVYVAEQTEPVRRQVALKVIKPGMDSRQVVARFEAERQALALMDHPHIAKVFDAGTTDAGRPFFVMKLVRGSRITDFCDQHHLDTGARLQLFITVCQAIQHAHQKGIIHRDIKPSNILVSLRDGMPLPKVIDFGIAKATEGRLTDATLQTQLHQFVGTPAYMSPEQAELGAVDIDTRSDIYSLGVLLYELLTGQPPFDPRELPAAGLDAMRRTIREQEPARPSTRLSEQLARQGSQAPSGPVRSLIQALRGDLDWIVMKCLEKDRTRRYPTANGLAADLQRHLQNEPVVARPPSPLYRFQKMWRRHRLVFTAGSSVAAVLLVSVGVLAWSLGEQKVARRKAEAAEIEQGHQRIKAEAASQAADDERDRAARLLSVSQAVQGVELLAKQDPTGLLYLLEARRSVDHLAEDRLLRTLLWSGWAESLARTAEPAPGGTNRLFSTEQHSSHPWVAAGSTNGDITIRDREGGALRATIRTGNRPVSMEELSANGRLLLANVSGARELWDLGPVHSNQPPQRLVRRILRHAFDPQRRRLLTFANEGLPMPGEPQEAISSGPTPSVFAVQTWDSAAESALATTWAADRQDLSNHQFALSPDGSKVAAGWHALGLFDARTGQAIPPQLSTNVPGRGRSFFVPPRFSPNGRWLGCRRTAVWHGLLPRFLPRHQPGLEAGAHGSRTARVSSRLEQFPLDDQATVLFAVRQPMWEAHLALEWFTKAQPKFATAFGRDIVASIPAGRRLAAHPHRAKRATAATARL